MVHNQTEDMESPLNEEEAKEKKKYNSITFPQPRYHFLIITLTSGHTEDAQNLKKKTQTDCENPMTTENGQDVASENQN